MPFSRFRLNRIKIFTVFILCLLAGSLGSGARGEESSPIHASGDKEVWNRALNRVELFGHASVRQSGESLSADYIILDQKARTLDAHGNCVYLADDAVIFGEEMHFNLETRTGSVIAGRVSTDRFTLAGERINKLGPGRFQTHRGEYSTCRDCTQSWTMLAQDVDMQIEGYAHLSNVKIKVKDAPALWIPYMILPMKTQRQTGLLFPKYTLNSINGLMFVQPFFWAINRSSDMTIGLGRYTDRGNRAEWEGRYALTDRSTGTANFWYLNDKKFANEEGAFNPTGNRNRWALDVSQTQELPLGLEEKLRVTDVSDNLYPYYFNDIPQNREAFLASSLNFSFTSPYIFGNLGAKRYRNLLNLNPDTRSFDQGTVQALPTADVTTNSRLLFGTPLIGGIKLSATNFTRAEGPFDQDALADPTAPIPVYNPIRKGTRLIAIPSLYTVISPIEGFSLVPSAEYHAYYYNFHQAIPDLFRGYAQFQLSLETQFEKIYDTTDPETPRIKHLIRPILNYSNIPFLTQDTTNPFLGQIAYADSKNLFGYNFDVYDIIPRDTTPATVNYFVPLGNSVSYGFKTQILQRHETLMVNGVANPNVPATYRVPVELSAGQTFNFREYQTHAASPQPLSRLFANLKTNHREKLLTDTTYYYYPYSPGIRSQLTTSMSYILERSMHQRILAFDRSFFFNYSWSQVGYTGDNPTARGSSSAMAGLNFSLSDYILPTGTVSRDFVNQKFTAWAVNLQFQSPSQCWKITTGVSFDLTRGKQFDAPSISLNLTGNGFEGVSDIAASQGAAVPK